MKTLYKLLALFAALCPLQVSAQNQTETLSPILPEDSLPFTLSIEQAGFNLPTGLQAYVSAIYENKWILLAGRTNGLHGFDNLGNNFPPNFQNTTVFVIDPITGKSHHRSLTESGLSQTRIDDLSATASEVFQKGHLLYVVGGYGFDHDTQTMGTRSTLVEINLKTLVHWVKTGKPDLNKALRTVTDPYLQVTGGELYQACDSDPFLLIFGQNFIGDYRDNSNGIYTQQVRPFRLYDDGVNLSITPLVNPLILPDYRRRDLNVIPIIYHEQPAFVALSGVFTLTTGVWTVPVTIFANGISNEPSPNLPDTFKQGMNNYNCAAFSLYSGKNKESFLVLPGGITYGYFSGGEFETDSEIPFTNQITTVKIDKHGNFSQYLMDNEYPFIASTGTNPGNQLLFGAEAVFFPAKKTPLYSNGVIKFDNIKDTEIIGYIAGGIMSTLPNTNTRADSTSSPYVFAVRLTKRHSSSH